MAAFWTSAASLLVISIVAAISNNQVASVNIGVCYGTVADNLPSPSDVVGLYKKYGIAKVRLFEPNATILEALSGSQIAVTLGTRNEDTPNLASSEDAANSWFTSNVEPYLNNINLSYITVGNEIVPGEFSQYIAPAMSNFQAVIEKRGLKDTVKVSTVIAASTLGASYPPSAGAFSEEAAIAMSSILKFLSAQKSPLMINVYPYFAYASDPYAQFTASGSVVVDGSLSYSNLFDAIVDAFFSAMEKLGTNDVNVVITESGWPSDGNGNITTPELASTYNKNFINHITNNGTPKRPQSSLEGFIFAMFEENLKMPAGVENHFGLFYPNMEPVYPVFQT